MKVEISNDILQKVKKPARYTGGEFNSIQKNWDSVSCRMVLALPDVYEVGMSNLGLAILYGILNKRSDTLCERVYAVWTDFEEEMRAKNIPLFSLESKRAVKDFDFFGFSLQYEMIFTNVLNMLDLAKINLHAAERTIDEPFVIGGGPCVYNVEPMADFFDFFVIGEGEEILGEVAEKFIEWKSGGKIGGRRGFLKKLLSVNGIYVPCFYEPIYDDKNFIGLKILENAPQKIYKRVVKNMNDVATVEKPLVPFIDIVHNRAMLEIFRGCTRGCRFCQAGMCYRPARERTVENLKKTARRLIDVSGYDEMSLTSLSSADYSCLNRLVEELMADFRNEKISFSLPSLRIDSFSIELADKLQAVRKSGLTFAPEAGTQRLRDVINKNVTEENLLAACGAAFEKGWKTIKLYFMMGLPTETDEDIAGIADLAQKVANLYRQIKKRRDIKITVSVSCFVPKPFTPFQWYGQISLEEFMRRQKLLKSLITDKAITYNYHDAKLSVLEGAIARGDRRLCKVIETAWRNGAKFDGWTDLFKFEAWQSAFESCGVDMKYFSERSRNIYEPLPWEHTSPGVNKNFLISEMEKSERGETTRDCRRTSCTGCGVCMNLGVSVVDYAGESRKCRVKSNNPLSTFPSSLSPTKYRAQIRKGNEIAFLSHLEYMNVFMSALLRSKLPAAYSEGFNPHLKISFATALGVGVTSDCEYVDFELAQNIKSNEVMTRLNSHLPKGAEILRIRKISGKVPALTAAIDFSRYEIFIDADFEESLNAAEKFNAAKEINFTRVTPKHTREIEIKKYIAEPLKVSTVDGEILLTFGTKIFLDGTIKPSEILQVLREKFNLNIEVTAAKINRTALLSHGKNLLDVL